MCVCASLTHLYAVSTWRQRAPPCGGRRAPQRREDDGGGKDAASTHADTHLASFTSPQQSEHEALSLTVSIARLSPILPHPLLSVSPLSLSLFSYESEGSLHHLLQDAANHLRVRACVFERGGEKKRAQKVIFMHLLCPHTHTHGFKILTSVRVKPVKIVSPTLPGTNDAGVDVYY